MQSFSLIVIALIVAVIPTNITIGQDVSDEALAARSGCLECHGEGGVAVGPNFRDIANRYRNDPGARDALIGAVVNGSKGNWTEVSRGVPMPPYSARLNKPEIAQLVDWILRQKDED